MAKKIEYTDEIDNVHTIIRRRKDEIIELVSNESHVYEIKDIKENHEAIKKLSRGKKALCLTITGKYASVSRESRDFVASGPHVSFIKAEAFIVRSLAHKILARFYIKMSKPKVKTGFFTSVESALKWLKEKVDS